MSYGYSKLCQSILDSSIWMEPWDIKGVWITMLAMADSKGRVFAAIPGIAHRATVSLETAAAAIEKFQQPDPYSRSKEHEGRRIEEIDGGWRLLNYQKYRELRDPESRREQVREAVKRHREKQADVIHGKPDVSRGKPEKAQAEAEAEAEADKRRGGVPVKPLGTSREAESGQSSPPLDGYAEIPTPDEVVEFGRCRGIPAQYCREYHAKTDENNAWLNRSGYLHDWRKRLQRFWGEDRGNWKPKRSGPEKLTPEKRKQGEELVSAFAARLSGADGSTQPKK